MPNATHCPECGAPLPADSPKGLCSRCALQGALEMTSGETQVLHVESSTDASSTHLAEKPGERVGRYKLLEKIGEGGCGVVYMAEQEEPVRRRVALKIIKLGMDTRQVIARFEAERQALAMMDHPNIAKIFDAGVTQNLVHELEGGARHSVRAEARPSESGAQGTDAPYPPNSVLSAGRPYFVMELVRGVKITAYCDQNNLSTGDRLDLFVKVCQAVQHAHQKGIIHRDLKPSNILVTVNDDVAVPKVIDFGVAKATGQQRLTDKTLFTAFEQFIGTPAYMSPEQALMTSLDIDTRSDIYSLGVLLYEMLTSKTPFDTKELMAAGLDEIRRTIREQEPARPSTCLSTMLAGELTATAKHRQSDALKLINLLRGDLDWIVMKALEKDRTRRYETANGFAMDIQRHLSNEPVIARPPSAAYRFQKLVRRNKLAFAAVIAVAATLVLGVAGIRWQLKRALYAEQVQGKQLAVAREARARETQQRLRADRERAQAEDHAQQSLTQLIRSHVATGNKATEEGDLFGALPWFAEALRLEPAANSARIEMHRLRLATTLRQCPRLVQIFFHTNQVRDAQFSPDGTRIVTACRDGTARIWDFATGREIAVLKHRHPVNRAIFSLDGRKIATATGEREGFDHWSEEEPKSLEAGEARVWDAVTGEAITPWMYHSNTVRNVAFSPDGQRVVTASWDHTAVIWDAASGEAQVRFTLHTRPVGRAEFSPDGKLVVSGDSNGKVFVWDAISGRTNLVVSRDSRDSRVPASGRFSPDGRRVLTASGDGTAWVLDAVTGERITHGTIVPGGSITVSAFSPDGERVVTGAGSQAQVWDASTGAQVTPPLPHAGAIYGTAFSPDGRSVITASGDKTARLWDAKTGQALTPPLPHNGAVRSAVFSLDGRFVLTASHDHTARVWDLATLESSNPEVRLNDNEEIIEAVISPDGLIFVTPGADNTVAVWSAVDGKLIKGLSKLPSDGRSRGNARAAFSPDGRWLVVKGGASEAGVWKVENFEPVWQPRQEQPIMSIAVSFDSRRLITASQDGTAQVWDIATGEKLLPPLKHQDAIYSALFSPNGRRILTASRDRSARVWDAATGEQVTSLLGHRNEVAVAAFSHDGRWVITGSKDETACVWDAATGTTRTPPLEHTLAVSAVEFSPDDTRVLTASADGTAQVWDATTGRRLTTPMRHRDQVRRASFSRDSRLIVTAAGKAGGRVWDAETGEAVSPPLKHAESVTDAAFRPDGRSVLTTAWDGARLWTLPRDERPSEDWTGLAQLLSGSRIDPGIGLVPIDLMSLSNHWQTLRAKYPSEFALLMDRTLAWHEREAAASEASRQWAAVSFHLNWPAAPGASAGDQQAARTAELKKLIPPRDVRARPALIDLSKFYNGALTENWLEQLQPARINALPRPSNDLASLPRGLQTFGNVEFDVRGGVQLAGGIVTNFPKRVDGIPVNQNGRRLHFLHAVRKSRTLPDQTELGSFIIHYANRPDSMVKPIRLGLDVREWWGEPDNPKSPAVVVWTGTNDVAKANGSFLRLFKTTWKNPHPDEPIASIDYASAMTAAAPFLIAITVE